MHTTPGFSMVIRQLVLKEVAVKLFPPIIFTVKQEAIVSTWHLLAELFTLSC